MALFGSNAHTMRAARLQRELREVTAQRDALAAQLFNAEQEAVSAGLATPLDVSEAVAALKRRVPSLPLMPNWAVLSSAKTADEFAQGLHLALLQAHSIGQREGATAAHLEAAKEAR
ncbi:hypothetical protein SAMN02800687_2757 [Curtobacterium sp. UNCCL20]|uniref:hypothetical protein n=1 Tax=Curtobacterium sp. UNCCL20 TaxID=1502773 RepID=UPI000890C7FD|nr:hypothetical protein [Curtobacterium sp. UNCCL20]SDQ83205.1 hypothetical protein SAMN02800687_2757 [Curtobacterium sp. UNCCL20]